MEFKMHYLYQDHYLHFQDTSKCVITCSLWTLAISKKGSCV